MRSTYSIFCTVAIFSLVVRRTHCQECLYDQLSYLQSIDDPVAVMTCLAASSESDSDAFASCLGSNDCYPTVAFYVDVNQAGWCTDSCHGASSSALACAACSTGYTLYDVASCLSGPMDGFLGSCAVPNTTFITDSDSRYFDAYGLCVGTDGDESALSSCATDVFPSLGATSECAYILSSNMQNGYTVLDCREYCAETFTSACYRCAVLVGFITSSNALIGQLTTTAEPTTTTTTTTSMTTTDNPTTETTTIEDITTTETTTTMATTTTVVDSSTETTSTTTYDDPTETTSVVSGSVSARSSFIAMAVIIIAYTPNPRI